MATTITASTLTVTLSESLSLGGQQFGGSKELTISSITEAFKRVVTCPASNTTTLITFNSDVHGAAGAVDVENAKYLRISNLDDTNAVEVAVVGAATLYQVRLDAGQSHLIGAPEDYMLAEADTSPSFGAMADIASVQVNPAGNDVDVEIFVAGV